MATIKLDEAWIKDALVTIEDVTDKEVTDLLKDLADKRIKTVQNILDAGAGETWKTVNGPPLFKDLVFKAAQAVLPVLSGPSSVPGADPKSFLGFIEDTIAAYPPSKPVKSSDTPLQERQPQISQVSQIVSDNIAKSTTGSAKAMHQIPIFTGAAGIGKTTLAMASAQYIMNNFDSIARTISSEFNTKRAICLSIDFSNGCRLNLLDTGLSPSIVIGLRIAYTYFAAQRTDFPTFRTIFTQYIKLFTVGHVLAAIRRKEAPGDNDLLYTIVHIDEVQNLFDFVTVENKAMFKEIVYTLGDYSIKRPEMVQVFISGTAHTDVMRAREPTMYTFAFIDNPPLSLGAVFALINHFALKFRAHSHHWVLSRPFVRLLIDIDGLPRALECLFDECFGATDERTRGPRFFSELLQPKVSLQAIFIRVAASIQSKYGIRSFIETHRETAELVLAHVLLNKPIDANTTLGGQSMEELERSGHVFFQRNAGSIRFRMSYLFITIYNEYLGILPQPVAAALYQDTTTDWQDWERFNAYYESFRNNSFVAFAELQKSVGDLYAGALGTTATRSKLVTLRKIDSVKFLVNHFPSNLGTTDKHSGPEEQWQTGASLLVNGKNASFGDTVSFRRLAADREHIIIFSGQEKWDYNGKQFTASEAIDEHNKAKGTAAKSELSKYFHKYTIVTICFTSQPVDSVPTTDDVLVVSRESFQQYYGAFADCATFAAASTFNPNYADIQHLSQQIQQVSQQKAMEIVQERMKAPYVSPADFLKRTGVHAPASMSFFPCDLLASFPIITPQTTHQTNTTLEFPTIAFTHSPASNH